MGSRITTINNIDYKIFDFNYVSGKYKGEEYFVLIDNLEGINKSKVQKGELYIIIPSWVEMQDVFSASSFLNIHPDVKGYEIDLEVLKTAKMKLLCTKIIDADGEVIILTIDNIKCLYPSMAQFLLRKIDETIAEYYIGTGLDQEFEKMLSEDCNKYYKSITKQGAGHDVNIPPCPGVVLLLHICKIFNCTPNVARQISKRDIDMVLIAKEQESFCSDPNYIGMHTKKPQQ